MSLCHSIGSIAYHVGAGIYSAGVGAVSVFAGALVSLHLTDKIGHSTPGIVASLAAGILTSTTICTVTPVPFKVMLISGAMISATYLAYLAAMVLAVFSIIYLITSPCKNE